MRHDLGTDCQCALDPSQTWGQLRRGSRRWPGSDTSIPWTGTAPGAMVRASARGRRMPATDDPAAGLGATGGRTGMPARPGYGRSGGPRPPSAAPVGGEDRGLGVAALALAAVALGYANQTAGQRTLPWLLAA